VHAPVAGGSRFLDLGFACRLLLIFSSDVRIRPGERSILDVASRFESLRAYLRGRK